MGVNMEQGRAVGLAVLDPAGVEPVREHVHVFVDHHDRHRVGAWPTETGEGHREGKANEGEGESLEGIPLAPAPPLSLCGRWLVRS